MIHEAELSLLNDYEDIRAILTASTIAAGADQVAIYTDPVGALWVRVQWPGEIGKPSLAFAKVEEGKTIRETAMAVAELRAQAIRDMEAEKGGV